MPNSYSSEHITLLTASLISKQAVPFRTCGSTYCPGVSTPKTRSLADSSITNHITEWNPTVSTIPTHAQTIVLILTTVISHHDGWKTKSLNNNTSQTQHHKDGKTCMTLMTAWLSITNCDRTTSEMRGLSPKIISGDSRRSENAQTHTNKHTIPNMKFKLKLLQIKCHVLGFTKGEAQNALQKITRVCGSVCLSRQAHALRPRRE